MKKFDKDAISLLHMLTELEMTEIFKGADDRSKTGSKTYNLSEFLGTSH